MAAGGEFVFEGDQYVGEKIGSLGCAALDDGLVAFLTGSDLLPCSRLLPLGMGLCMAGRAEGLTRIKGAIFLDRMGVKQGGTCVGAMHLPLGEMTAYAGDSFLLVKGAAFYFSGTDLQGAVTFEAFFFRRAASSLLKGRAGEGLCMGCALPFSILVHMTCAALAGPGPFKAFGWNTRQVAKGGATSQQEEAKKENNSSVPGCTVVRRRHGAKTFLET
jgi:hypothetical protein